VEYEEYSSRFESFNREKSGWSVETFSMISREEGAIVAGGRGFIYLGALEIRGLWVDEIRRGGGIGSALLGAIEDEARLRKATKAMLYTYSWQAERFYKAHGYKEFGRFNFPEGHYRIDMEKSL
jgi:GNAT superfamily N-acetyltransferase